ncbi:MAG: DUF2263 domain-containing protein [Clostridia bacterium]|nr:DUF2263 domain-containing protein [Clostridia bacterium]
MARVKNVTLQSMGDVLHTPFISISTRRLVKNGWSGKLGDFVKNLLKYRWKGTRDYSMAVIMVTIIVAASKDEKLKNIIQREVSQSKLMQLFTKIGAGEGQVIKSFLDNKTTAGAWFKTLFMGLLDNSQNKVDEIKRTNLWTNFTNQVGKMTPWKINEKYVRENLCNAIVKAFGAPYAKKVEEQLPPPSGPNNGGVSSLRVQKHPIPPQQQPANHPVQGHPNPPQPPVHHPVQEHQNPPQQPQQPSTANPKVWLPEKIYGIDVTTISDENLQRGIKGLFVNNDEGASEWFGTPITIGSVKAFVPQTKNISTICGSCEAKWKSGEAPGNIGDLRGWYDFLKGLTDSKNWIARELNISIKAGRELTQDGWTDSVKQHCGLYTHPERVDQEIVPAHNAAREAAGNGGSGTAGPANTIPQPPVTAADGKTVKIYWPKRLSDEDRDLYKELFTSLGKQTGLILTESTFNESDAIGAIPFLSVGKKSRFGSGTGDAVVKGWEGDENKLSRIKAVFEKMQKDTSKDTTEITLPSFEFALRKGTSGKFIQQKSQFVTALEYAIEGIDEMLGDKPGTNVGKGTAPNPVLIKVERNPGHDTHHYGSVKGLKGEHKFTTATLAECRRIAEDKKNGCVANYQRRFYIGKTDGEPYRHSNKGELKDAKKLAAIIDSNNEKIREYFAAHPDLPGAKLECEVTFDDIVLTGDTKRHAAEIDPPKFTIPFKRLANGVYMCNTKGQNDLVTVASDLIDHNTDLKKVLVLNAASQVTPGGAAGWHTKAAEESLCADTSLYQSLTAGDNDEFYVYGKDFPYIAAKISIAKGVVIFPKGADRQRTSISSADDVAGLRRIDILSHASPNFNTRLNVPKGEDTNVIRKDDAKALKAIQDSANQIVKAAVKGGYQVLVINNLGGGAFSNSIVAWARAFKSAIANYGGNLIVVLALFDYDIGYDDRNKQWIPQTNDPNIPKGDFADAYYGKKVSYVYEEIFK